MALSAFQAFLSKLDRKVLISIMILINRPEENEVQAELLVLVLIYIFFYSAFGINFTDGAIGHEFFHI